MNIDEKLALLGEALVAAGCSPAIGFVHDDPAIGVFPLGGETTPGPWVIKGATKDDVLDQVLRVMPGWLKGMIEQCEEVASHALADASRAGQAMGDLAKAGYTTPEHDAKDVRISFAGVKIDGEPIVDPGNGHVYDSKAGKWVPVKTEDVGA